MEYIRNVADKWKPEVKVLKRERIGTHFFGMFDTYIYYWVWE